jgi:DtxR family manganese transport transcriptional regulator
MVYSEMRESLSRYDLRNNARSRLESIRDAHNVMTRKNESCTYRMEDYLEVIYELVENKGYATSVDISEYLNVRPPSVTKMVKRLNKTGYLVYERYRGIMLTKKGRETAKQIRTRHSTVYEFLLLLGVDENTANKDAEGIEHYLTSLTLTKLERFVHSLKQTQNSH